MVVNSDSGEDQSTDCCSQEILPLRDVDRKSQSTPRLCVVPFCDLSNAQNIRKTAVSVPSVEYGSQDVEFLGL
jgi:hypothetical protein